MLLCRNAEQFSPILLYPISYTVVVTVNCKMSIKLEKKPGEKTTFYILAISKQLQNIERSFVLTFLTMFLSLL